MISEGIEIAYIRWRRYLNQKRLIAWHFMRRKLQRKHNEWKATLQIIFHTWPESSNATIQINPLAPGVH